MVVKETKVRTGGENGGSSEAPRPGHGSSTSRPGTNGPGNGRHRGVPGSGAHAAGTVLLDAAPPRPRIRRAGAAKGPPPNLSVTGVAPKMPRFRWGRGLIGGAVVALGIFLVLGYIQPVLKKGERVEIPTALRIALQKGSQDQKRQTGGQKQKPESRSQSRAESRPQTGPKKMIRSAPTKQVAQERSQMSDALKGIQLASPVGLGVGGGATVAVSFSVQESEALEKGRETREYHDRRAAIREGREMGDGGRRALAGGGGGGPVAIGGIGGAADRSYMPAPKYPPKALKDGTEGSVTVKVLVSVTGSIEKFEILSAEPPGLFEAAIAEVLPKWRLPVSLDDQGRPIEYWDEFTYQFELEAASI